MPSYKIDDKTGKLSAETVAALSEAIPDADQEAVLRWMEARGWIGAMGGLHELSVQRAQLILNKPDVFIAKVKAAATTGAKP